MDSHLEDSHDAIEPPTSGYGAMRIADALTLTGLVAVGAVGTSLLLARAPMLVWLDSLPKPVIQALLSRSPS